MNSFAVEIWNDEGKRCTFYTVRWQDAKVNEADKFFEKYYAITEFKEASNIVS